VWRLILVKFINRYMIILSNTTDKIQAVLTNAVTTNQLSCLAVYRDTTSTSITPLRNVLLTNGVTPVDFVGSPASSTQRVIDYLSIFNRDTAVAEVTIRFVDNVTNYRLFVVRLAPNEKLEYQEGYGFKVISNGYSIKQTTTFDSPTTNTNLSMFVLKNDITLSPSVANAYLDIPSLTFPVVANSKVYFKFFIIYTTDNTTTGTRFNILGPSASGLITYQTFNSLTSTSITIATGQNTYLNVTSSNATSANKDGNTVNVEGYIYPDTNGIVIPSFGCEVSLGSVTIKSNSFVQYHQIA